MRGSFRIATDRSYYPALDVPPGKTDVSLPEWQLFPKAIAMEAGVIAVGLPVRSVFVALFLSLSLLGLIRLSVTRDIYARPSAAFIERVESLRET